MSKESGFTRADYEQVPEEFSADYEKIQSLKEELAGLAGKFIQKEPGILQSLYTAFKGFEFQARAGLYKDSVESRRAEVIENAHENALGTEEKHRALQVNVVRAIEELTSFEKDELGRSAKQTETPE